MNGKFKRFLCVMLSVLMILSLNNVAFAKKASSGSTDAAAEEKVLFSDDFSALKTGLLTKIADLTGWGASSAFNGAACVAVMEEDGNKFLKFYNGDPTTARSPRADILVPIKGMTKLTLSYRVKPVGKDVSVSAIHPDMSGDNKNKKLGTLATVPDGSGWTDVTVVIDVKKMSAESFIGGKSAGVKMYDASGLDTMIIRFTASCEGDNHMLLDDVKLTSPDSGVGGLCNVMNGDVNYEYIKTENPSGVLDVVRKTHPRIFFNDWDEIRNKIETDYNCKVWYDKIVSYSEGMLKKDPQKYFRNDRNNINDCSTSVKQSLVPMALAAGITKREDFVDRVYKELLSAGDWPDWGADAWLCTAHLLLGYACAYDWCYDLFTPAQRDTIRKIMKEKGFAEAVRSYEGYSNTNFVSTTNNWCQVCNGSVLVAALSVWDEEPEIADYMISHALECLPHGLIELKPDGSYCEPLSYWDYGIRHQVKAMSALDSSLEDGKKLPKVADFSDFPGMDKTGDFPIYYNGTTGAFNYGDGASGLNFSQILFYFAKKYNRPDWSGYVLDMEEKVFGFSGINAAEALVWYDPAYSAPPSMTLDREYHNEDKSGANGLSFRDSFDDTNAFVAMMIAGDLTAAHSDLNAGGFVLDWNGKRWVHMYGRNPGGVATCYGWPNYHNHTPLNGHYQYYHARGEANNTLIANPTEYPDQNYQSFNKVIKTDFGVNTSYGIVDMTATNDAYSDAKRGMMLTDGRSRLVIQDEVKLKSESEFYWFANTLAEITIAKDGRSALLEYDGDRMLVRMTEAPSGAAFSIMDTVPLPTSPNPSAQAPIDEHKLAIHLEHISGSLNLSVEFIPLRKGEGAPEESKFVPMSEWTVDKDGKEPIKNKLFGTVALKINTPKAFAKGAYTYVDTANYDVMPIIKDDRTLVPVRFISESFGANVGWNSQTRQASVSYRDKNITLTLDDKNMIVNGDTVELDVPAQVVNDRTFIPLRALVEALGKEVMWDDRGLIVIADSTGHVTDGIKDELIDRLDITIKAGDDYIEGFDIDKSDYYITKDVCDVSVFANNNAKTVSVAQGNPAVVTIGDKAYNIHFVKNSFDGILGTGSAGVIQKIVLEDGVVEDKDGYQPYMDVVSVSASTFGSYPERGTVDGIISDDTSNRWSQTGEQWLCFDFGEEKTLHSFALQGMNADTREYKLTKVEVSSDGQSWNTVLSGVKTMAVNGPTVFDMGDVRARFIKVTGDGYTGKAEGPWNSWAEFRFYENADMQKYDISHWGRTFGFSSHLGTVGETFKLYPKGFDTNSNPVEIDPSIYTLTYESTNPEVVTVDNNGNVTVVGAGSATVNVIAKSSIANRKGSIAITVQ